jgi:nucleoside-diphosphate-sugar epimerase
MLREVLGWEPSIPIEDGLVETYRWIEKQVRNQQGQ